MLYCKINPDQCWQSPGLTNISRITGNAWPKYKYTPLKKTYRMFGQKDLNYYIITINYNNFPASCPSIQVSGFTQEILKLTWHGNLLKKLPVLFSFNIRLETFYIFCPGQFVSNDFTVSNCRNWRILKSTIYWFPTLHHVTLDGSINANKFSAFLLNWILIY